MCRQLLSVSALAMVAVLATGCSDSDSSDEPDSNPPASDTASDNGSGNADGSNNPDAQGAEAYARRFVQLVNRAADTGETKSLHELVAKCSSCQQYPATYDDIYQKGGSVDGEFYKLLDVQTSMQDESTAQAVAKVKANTSTTFKLSKNAEPRPLRAETYEWTLTLERTDDGWQVVGMKEKF